MTFGDLYESVEDIDIRVVDDEKSYYARVTNREFDYDAIVDREIERIYVDVDGNLVAELKYKKERKNGNRKVSHYYVDMNKLYIVVE